MKKIKLGGKHGTIIGNFALVDDEDYGRLNKFTWYGAKLGTKEDSVYAARREHGSRTEERKHVMMHRIIMKADKNELVDHANGNSLDNRKKNLRKCTRSQNGMNRGIPSVNSSGYKGVRWHPGAKKWQARITKDWKEIYIGLYSTAKLAAKAYDTYAIQLHGEFARLNFPIVDKKP